MRLVESSGIHESRAAHSEDLAHLKSKSAGRLKSYLAAGKSIVEEAFTVDFPFDGRIYHDAQATFVDGDEILIGTHLIRSSLVTVDFPKGMILLQHEDET